MKSICQNCKHSRKARNKDALYCGELNDIHIEHEERVKRMLNVRGGVYEGWFSGGMGIINGYVVSKKASCDRFEKK